MSRRKKASEPVEPEKAASVAKTTCPRVTPHNSQTTSLVVAALRQNGVEGGPAYGRAELIAALSGCAIFSMELDGLDATLALLADAATILKRGYGGAGAERAAAVH